MDNIDQFVVDKKRAAIVDGEPEFTGYGRHGVSIDANSEGCLARASVDQGTGRRRFFIKQSTSGPSSGSGILYNPVNDFLTAENRRFDAQRGLKRYDFKAASEKKFELYMQFLKTENLAYLRNAEREI